MNFALLIAYDGANYCGWQAQDNGISVQSVLESAAELKISISDYDWTLDYRAVANNFALLNSDDGGRILPAGLKNIAISSMNTGWEMPGPFNASAEYKNLSARYEKTSSQK